MFALSTDRTMLPGCFVSLGLQALRIKTPRTATKAMRLLGLSEMPLDVSNIEHPSALGRPLSFRSVGAGSSSKLMSPPASVPMAGTRLSWPPSHRPSIHSSSTEAVLGIGMPPLGPSPLPSSVGSMADPCEDGIDIGCGGSGGSGYEEMSVQHYRHPSAASRSERLSVTETPLTSFKLVDTDIDDKFLKLIRDLMSKFPEPPSTSYTTRSSGVSTEAERAEFVAVATGGGRGRKGEGRRGLHPSKSFVVWRGGDRQQRQHQHQQQQQTQHFIERRQEPQSEQVDGYTTFDFENSINRVCTTGDLFEL